MKIEGQDVLLSASDLMRFMGCVHATAMDLRYATGEPLVPAEDSQDAKILQKQGDDHELRFLSKLRTERRSVIELSREEKVGPQQEYRMTREQGKRTLLAIANRTVNEPVAKLLFNTSALGLAAFEGLGASHPNADADPRSPDWK